VGVIGGAGIGHKGSIFIVRKRTVGGGGGGRARVVEGSVPVGPRGGKRNLKRGVKVCVRASAECGHEGLAAQSFMGGVRGRWGGEKQPRRETFLKPERVPKTRVI